jgi:addiction module HigA family antidote
MKTFIQKNPPHPGEMLFELYLGPLKLSIKQAALKTSISQATISEIVGGKTHISAAIAMKLSKAFKTTPQYWLNMQENYNSWNKLKSK